MNPQIQYICCHRIKPVCSDFKQQVISIHRSADFFINSIKSRTGDNILSREWYVTEVTLSYFTSLDEFVADTPMSLESFLPLATLGATDEAVTWNKEHPLYATLVAKPELSTTV